MQFDLVHGRPHGARVEQRLELRLRSLQEEERSVVWVTHDPELAAQASDQALVLARGRVVARVEGGRLNAPILGEALDRAGEAA